MLSKDLGTNADVLKVTKKTIYVVILNLGSPFLMIRLVGFEKENKVWTTTYREVQGKSKLYKNILNRVLIVFQLF
jgi:hypothetical protein